MIVGDLQVDHLDDGSVRRRVTVRAGDRTVPLTVEGPAGAIDESDDLSGALCAALPMAMRTERELVVDGPVDPRLARSLEDLQALYLAWDRSASPVDVRLREVRAPGASGRRRRLRSPAADSRGTAAFFSRGVDSVFTAASSEGRGQPLDALVFVDGLEPIHSDGVRAEEVRRAHAAAADIGLPLVVVRTDVREFFDPAGFDWEDAVGAALAFIAHSLASGWRRVVIPSGDSYATVEPCGTSPLLDPLFSTTRTDIVHDSLARSRLGKVGWLVEHRPDLIGDLKVCFREDRADNCGRCGKCLLTMVCLHIHGVLGDAVGFPDEVDVDAIRAFRLPMLKARMDWAEVAGALASDGVDGELRAAALDTIRTSSLDGPAQFDREGNPVWTGPWWLRNHRLNETLSLVVDGVPYPPIDGSSSDSSRST